MKPIIGRNGDGLGLVALVLALAVACAVFYIKAYA